MTVASCIAATSRVCRTSPPFRQPATPSHLSQVTQIVRLSLVNRGNRGEMVGWHASNEPTEAQLFKNPVGPIEHHFIGPLLGVSGVVYER